MECQINSGVTGYVREVQDRGSHPSSCELLSLPEEIILKVLSNLNVPDLSKFSLASKKSCELGSDEQVWKVQCKKDFYITVKKEQESWKTNYLQRTWKKLDILIKQLIGAFSDDLVEKSEAIFNKCQMSLANREIIAICWERKNGFSDEYWFTCKKVHLFCKSRGLSFDKILEEYYEKMEIENGSVTYYNIKLLPSHIPIIVDSMKDSQEKQLEINNLLSDQALQEWEYKARSAIASFFADLQPTSKE